MRYSLMPNKVYSFVEQWEKGLEGEKVLDQYFSRWYDIKEATLEQQTEEKIDRLFRPKGSLRNTPWRKIEYKTDSRTDKTGNLFIETWSVVERRRYGWAYTTHADEIMYYALPDTVYILNKEELQRELPNWLVEYDTKLIPNKNYTTAGIPVPVDVIVELIGNKRVRRIP
jgi:hypothetical protein